MTVEAAAGAILVHCGQSEARCDGGWLSLPRAVRAVYVDLLSGLIPTVAMGSNCSSLALAPIEAGAVRLFSLEDPGRTDLLGGGLISSLCMQNPSPSKEHGGGTPDCL